MGEIMSRAFTPTLAALFLATFAGDAAAGPLPKDPCAILKAEDLRSIASTTVGSGRPEVSAPIAAGCTYTWGPKSEKWGQTTLSFFVSDLSKAYPGMNPDLIKQGLLMKVKAGGSNASQIAGVGDAGAFSIEARSHNALAEALLLSKGYHVAVTYHHGDSAASKDKLTALLKLAAGRL
jgi:hypothetical protein